VWWGKHPIDAPVYVLLHRDSLGCCWKHCATALMYLSNLNLWTINSFLWGPNTWKSHAHRCREQSTSFLLFCNILGHYTTLAWLCIIIHSLLQWTELPMPLPLRHTIPHKASILWVPTSDNP
jgi:hypothetical protein